ncbi:uncharacterized protein Z518_03357 [Rhinocladiella mackenziei CBS 650.93]|uniref:Nucleoside phosphorylase domain-containing protein n=1 Tax=Rhinocladiella mackenziei CBS 650.93 TaxID=1442369 RepID=A0A0D2JH58_9EURO|nr:uncharacterized protein Z518_03357 [Rhinocladiella mackenziei CBS 650.93]KIX08700.1 hypothetical protein Z518_03357 [Rhinocladiella mackenziei CBS 650.93]
MLRRYPDMADYDYPGQEHDQLFESDYQHEGGKTCQNCDIQRVRKRRQRLDPRVRVHYGTIGSSNSVIRDAVERDKLKQKYNILCVEMEAAGLMAAAPCLVIRGICDYADSHKNKQWQPFAAAAAASYAKELLLVLPPVRQSVTRNPTSAEPYDLTRSVSMCTTPILGDGDPGPNSRQGTMVMDNPNGYQRLLDSLTFERMDARLMNVSNALTKTCTWLFQEEKFKLWIKRSNIEDHQGFLWTKGKPGSGKSTMMKKALETVKRQQPRDIIISYFFNARAPGQLEKSSLGMYRSLVYQVLQASPRFQGRFVEMFASKDRGGAVDDWTAMELQGFLTDVVEGLGDLSLNIFIDALDEGNENDVRHLVAFLEDLSLNAVTYGKLLRICLSSRHYLQISIQKGLSLVMEHQDGHKDDIEMYVRKKLVGKEGARKSRLKDQICQKSSRVFLWVVLVIPILNQLYDRGQVAAMEKRLEEIPTELEGLFAEILARNAEDIHISVLLLQWVLFGMRPLSPLELSLAIQIGSTSAHSTGAISWSDEEELHRFLLDCSRGLTEITRTKPPVVQFIHETVREFLVRENGLENIDKTLSGNVKGRSHDRLKTVCVRYFDEYFSLDQKKYQPRSIPECTHPREEIQRELPLAEYIVNHMFSHADIAEGNGIRNRQFLRRFQARNSDDRLKWVQYRNTFQRHRARKYTVEVNLLYILAEQNLANLARVLIDDKANVNAHGQRYGNALQTTCAGGHHQMAQLLVERGADVGATGGEQRYALCAAIHGKHESIIRLLVGTNMLPPIKALEKSLFLAIARGYLDGVKILLDAGVATNCTNYREETPLYLAVSKCKLAVVNLLLQRGADVDAKGGYYGYPLQTASARGYREIAQLLIEKGADINAQGGYYGNALQAASARGYREIARLLVEKGADINTQDGAYGYPLQTASAYGCVEIVQLLIEKGADVNAQGGYYGSALQAASTRGYQRIAHLLIEKGADVNAQGGHYGSALQAALRFRHDEVARLLTENGAGGK